MKQDERQVKQQQDEKARGSAELTSAQHSITSQLHPMLGGQTIAALQQPQPATRVSTLHQPMVAVTLDLQYLCLTSRPNAYAFNTAAPHEFRQFYERVFVPRPFFRCVTLSLVVLRLCL